MIRIITENIFWRTKGVLIARLLMGGIFILAAYMKFINITGASMYIATYNFPFPTFLTWVAGIFELVSGFFIITGIFFRSTALILCVYVIFLAFAFHGPSVWESAPYEFTIFIDRILMLVGLLYMAGCGPGKTWTLKRKLS